MTIRKIFIALGIIVISGFSFLAFQEFRRKPPIRNSYQIKTSGERVYKIADSDMGPGLELLSQATPTTATVSPTTTAIPTENVSLIFDKPLGFVEIDYPSVYAYDFDNRAITVFNLVDKTYQQIYNQATGELVDMSFSPNKQQIALKLRRGMIERYFLLDRTTDTLTELNPLIRGVFWFNEHLGYYLSDRGGRNYLAYLKREREFKLTDLALLEPVIEPLVTGDILISETPKPNRPAPLFQLKGRQLQLIFPSQSGLSAISDRSGGYIFVSYFQQGIWQSALLTSTGQLLKTFSFGTIREKCSFTTVLVCGIPIDQSGETGPWAWHEFRRTFIDKLFIYDPRQDQEVSVELPGNFDLLAPTLTQVGVIFTNRLDNKLYLVPMKKLPLNQANNSGDQPIQSKDRR